MWKRLFFSFFLLFCIAGGIWWFSYVNDVRAPVSEAIHAVPGNAAFIIESRKSRETWKKISQNSIFFQELLSTETFSRLERQARAADSILALHPAVASLLDGHPLIISAHMTGARSFGFLFVYSLPNLTYQPVLEDFMKELNNGIEPSPRDYDGALIRTIRLNNDSLSYSFVNGAWMISSDKVLVEDAVRQLRYGTSLARDPSFGKILHAAGQNVDCNLYVSYRYLPGILRPFTVPSRNASLSDLQRFAGASGWDCTFRPNSVMLSGFTEASDSAQGFLSLFRRQRPVNVTVTEAMPARTTLFVSLGLSSARDFRLDVLRRDGTLQNKFAKLRDTLRSKYDVDAEALFAALSPEEIALVLSGADSLADSYVVIRPEDAPAALEALHAVSDSIRTVADTFSAGGIQARNLGISGLFPNWLGAVFEKIRGSWYASTGDHIIFANSRQAMQKYLSSLTSQGSLATTEQYQAFSENLSQDANLFFFCSTSRALPLLSQWLEPPHRQNLLEHEEMLKKFEAFGIQFSSGKDLYFTHACLRFNPDKKNEAGTLWEIALDTVMAGQPHAVVNHTNQTRGLVVQDERGKLYFISNTGKVVWTKDLHEKIMGDVKQVDALRNGKLQLIFNTRSTIYCLDRNGNSLPGFPLELPSHASAPIELADYENNRNYRIILPTDDFQVRCYDVGGKAVTGFRPPATRTLVHVPVKYFKCGGTDNLCVVESSGQVTILNRQGAIKERPARKLPAGIARYWIDEGKDFTRCYLLAADSTGLVTKMTITGKAEQLRFEKFSSSPYFEYVDVNGDHQGDFVFCSREQLLVTDKSRNELCRVKFDETVMQRAFTFQHRGKECGIGVFFPEKEEIILHESSGKPLEGFPVTGTGGAIVSDINNDGKLVLICGAPGNSVYAYPLP